MLWSLLWATACPLCGGISTVTAASTWITSRVFWIDYWMAMTIGCDLDLEVRPCSFHNHILSETCSNIFYLMGNLFPLLLYACQTDQCETFLWISDGVDKLQWSSPWIFLWLFRRMFHFLFKLHGKPFVDAVVDSKSMHSPSDVFNPSSSAVAL